MRSVWSVRGRDEIGTWLWDVEIERAPARCGRIDSGGEAGCAAYARTVTCEEGGGGVCGVGWVGWGGGGGGGVGGGVGGWGGGGG
uniref:Uncharacterized protein n=1 Tax=Knipowitschia caucasica TaxID=637954 RepID=A0AAV2KYS4_KNICA